jgi:hypothetical protein
MYCHHGVEVSNWLYIGVDESMLPLSSVSCCFAVKSSDLVFYAPSIGEIGLSELGPFCSESLLHGFASRLHSCSFAAYPRSCGKETREEKEYVEFNIAFPNCLEFPQKSQHFTNVLHISQLRYFYLRISHIKELV